MAFYLKGKVKKPCCDGCRGDVDLDTVVMTCPKCQLELDKYLQELKKELNDMRKDVLAYMELKKEADALNGKLKKRGT